MKDSNTQQMVRGGTRARFGFTQRGALEAIGFVAALVVTVASAIAAKETTHAPALVATTPMVSDAPMEAPAIEMITALAEQTPGVTIEEATPAEVAELGIDPDSVRWFGGRKVRPARTLWMKVTAYSPDHRSCGKWADGITASNKSVWTNGMKLVAADTRLLPFGTLLSVPGYDEGRIVPVLDRGGAIKGNRLDVLYPTHAIARKWGVQKLPVTVWEYVD